MQDSQEIENTHRLTVLQKIRQQNMTYLDFDCLIKLRTSKDA